MSSYYSTITVTNDEWERMQRDISSAQAYQIRSDQEIARLQRLQEERRQELSRIQESNRQAVGRAADYINAAFQNNLAQLSENVRAQITAQSGAIDRQIDGIRSQAAQLNSRIASSSAAIENIAQRYHEAFQGILNTMNQGQGRAENVLSEMDRLIGQIRGLHPERFTPVAYSGLETMRANAAANIANGDYQAALIATQNGILNASRTLAQLIAMNEQYDSRYADVRNRLNTLQGRLDNLTSREGTIALDVGDEAMQFDYDIRYWSHGIFDEITGAVNAINEQMDRGSRTPLALSDLDALGQRIDVLNEQLTRCDTEARRDLASAITVDNTVTRLHSSLESRGWSLESSGRVDDDSRKPYSMVYSDGAGNTVSFVITAGKDPDRPAFFCEAFADDTPTAEVIKDGIGVILESEGFQAQDTVRRNDCSSNSSPDAFINNIVRETEQMAAARRAQVRNAVGI